MVLKSNHTNLIIVLIRYKKQLIVTIEQKKIYELLHIDEFRLIDTIEGVNIKG